MAVLGLCYLLEGGIGTFRAISTRIVEWLVGGLSHFFSWIQLHCVLYPGGTPKVNASLTDEVRQVQTRVLPYLFLSCSSYAACEPNQNQ